MARPSEAPLADLHVPGWMRLRNSAQGGVVVVSTILIVEDIELNLDLLTQILEDHYVLLLARDGAEAVRLAAEHHPDLVLMDMSLPVMDGFEATRAIRRNGGDGLPIIGLSAHAMEGDGERAVAAGCNEYLTKPVYEDQLFELLERYLGDD